MSAKVSTFKLKNIHQYHVFTFFLNLCTNLVKNTSKKCNSPPTFHQILYILTSSKGCKSLSYQCVTIIVKYTAYLYTFYDIVTKTNAIQPNVSSKL